VRQQGQAITLVSPRPKALPRPVDRCVEPAKVSDVSPSMTAVREANLPRGTPRDVAEVCDELERSRYSTVHIGRCYICIHNLAYKHPNSVGDE